MLPSNTVMVETPPTAGEHAPRRRPSRVGPGQHALRPSQAAAGTRRAADARRSADVRAPRRHRRRRPTRRRRRRPPPADRLRARVPRRATTAASNAPPSARTAPAASSRGGWTWPTTTPISAVHRLAHPAAQLLAHRRSGPPPRLRRLLLAVPGPLEEPHAQVVLDGRLRHERQEAALHREAARQADLGVGAADRPPCSRSSVPASTPRAQRSEKPAMIASAMYEVRARGAVRDRRSGTIPACSST